MGYVNKGIAKIDGMDIALGKPVYTDDICTGALVVKILRSPHAYARIKGIDVEKAQALPGVECVLTHEDVPKSKFTLAGQSYPEPSPYDRRILDEYVRYVGDEVAIVAAVDERTAEKALGLIKVDYEVIQPVLDFETAQESPSKVHVDDPHVSFDIGLRSHKNLAAADSMGYGDVEAELEKSEVVVEGTYYMQAQAHAMMETYRTWTHFDHAGRLNVVSSTQIPFHVRRILARALEIPASKIRVVKPRIGGGFGGKQTASVEIFPAIVTLKTGKPAKIIYSRRESFSCTTSRHAMRINVKVGADRDGMIKAIDMEALSDTGAYGEHCWTVFTVAGHKSLPLYNKANAVRYHGKVVYTNKMPAGALRGYGVTQGIFALESAVNELAQKLEMDPSVIREKNLMKQGEKSALLEGGDEKNPATLMSSSLDRCIEKGKKLIGWNEKYPCIKVPEGKMRGVGMAVTMQGSGIAGIDTASVMIKLNSEGFYTLMIGSTDMGTGCDTILAQMAAQILDTEMENITVHSADTDVSPYDTGSYASSTTYVTGNATIFAARDLRNKMIEKAADMWNVKAEDVEFDGKEITSKCGKSMSLSKFANTLSLGEGNLQLVGNGTFGGDTSPPPFIAGFAEVEVDMETGKVDLLDYVAVVDCGTVINPNLARIQVEGGIVQGIGIALYEDVQYSQGGRMITDTFMQYKIPCRKDIHSLKVEFEPSYEPTGPFGAKSVGEVVINTPAPAIADAVSNAVGKRFRKLPITPDKVLMKIME
ncbi:CO or xanthine dehydrogenase, Mo-binding subunit [Peptoclostridium litorale DSM 5388]|uniref:Putative hypoxanthine oxidase XdhD n=1 Tax=Peptoclostridium litorale DSM 5388 TaxID=1121324 RepID=A0A069RFC9_PEPLI|nr:molybdopterin cofactor-binding domain-containing protein [Peptoclostridium litorale]KDR95739.1 putative hypoxanthine oxidase XdhD [Peptoclostridium litorale DSM 5388]SIO22276.1 CO or xanthine dehydrogenase, Mo-binding subunit [Peptoclostridium litorale DSM 5388]